MVDEHEIFIRLAADLKATGINPDRYFESRRIDPSPDGFSSMAYAQQLADLYSSYARRFEDLQKAFESSRQRLIEWHKATKNAF